MSKQREDADFVADIEDSAEKIVRYVCSMTYDEFCEDSKTIDAVIRNLEVIGEATKNISESLKLRTPGIAWRGMAGLRDRLIHSYFGVDVDIVWKIAVDEVPGLLARLRELPL
ncbi:MAG: DUF86 domain-containing protein [Deltaproteobacteria bacterium]|jgi:uncharacterized protein with HEPN domain|nr:DUF86 domain-containing protein [Deltaproteobacteria bacterium]